MKPFYTKTTSNFDEPVSIRYDEMTNFYRHWHYHDEYELVYIHKSKGIRHVGDSIMPYAPGDLVLLGSRLPHIWLNDFVEGQMAALTVVHFQRKFVHNDFFSLTLMENVRSLFNRSAKGIRFHNLKEVESILNSLKTSSNEDKMIEVLNLLNQLARHPHTEILSSNDYQTVAASQRNDRFTRINDYIIRHFKEKIRLTDIAAVAKMTPQAFCCYFKKMTRKTVFTYINDLKIGYSRKLLIETDLNIDQVAFESGFNNTTFFNRKFKEKMKKTPNEYRRHFYLDDKL